MPTRYSPTSIARNLAALCALVGAPFLADRAAAQTPHTAAITTSQSQFQQPSVVLTGGWPASIESADLNGDTYPDLIYTDPGATATSSTTHILLNNGDGTFTPGQTIAIAGATVVVADFDRDGHPDLEWVSSVLGQGHVFFARGNADGTFAPPVQLGTFAQIGTNVPQLTYLAAAAMHPSGYLDLLVEDAANSALFELTADSSGTLVRLYGIHLPNGTGPISTADLNGDGNIDVIIQTTPNSAPGNTGGSTSAGGGGSIDVLFGNPDGRRTPRTSYTGPAGGRGARLQDIDSDGHLDLLIESPTGHLDLLHGNPDGTFSNTSEGGTNTLDPATGAGGHLIALTGQHLYTATPAGISALTLQPNLSLTLQSLYNAGPGHSSYAIADFNHDGTPDLAVDSSEGIAILFSNPDGTLQTSRAFSAGQPALTGTLSPSLDAILTTSSTQAKLLPGNADGTFGSPSAIPAPTPIAAPVLPANLPGVLTDPSLTLASVTSVDLDGDGHSDIIALFDNPAADHAHPSASTPNQLLIWYANPDGTYTTAPIAITPTRNFTQLIAADTQNDGLPDLILSDGYLVAILRNLGTRVFSPEQHLLAGSSITSISIADLNHDGAPDLVLSNGAPSTSALTPEVANGGITVLLNHLTAKAVTGALTAAPAATAVGQSYSITAAVRPMTAGPAATGNITFAVDGVAIGTVPVTSSGSATITSPPASTAGTHTLTAHYSGDSVYGSAMLNTAHAVTGISTTIALILTTPATISYGQTVDGYAQVQASDNSSLTGIVTFYDGPTTICTIPVSATASCPASTGTGFISGLHLLTAVYTGDATHAGATSTAVSVNVLPDATTATLTSSLNPATTGQPVTFTAKLLGSFATPVGPVNFLDNGSLIGTATVNPSGIAALSTTTLTSGTHSITAVYAATTNFNSSSAAVTQVVSPASTAVATATMLSSSANPAIVGQSVTITANVAATVASKIAPTGTISFTDSTGSSGNTILGTATLANGLATFTTSAFALGPHYITASYSGDPNNAASISSAFTQTINPIPPPSTVSFLLTPAVNAITLETGDGQNILVRVTPVNGFNQAVKLSCANLPDSATCTFATTTIPAGGATTTLKLTTAAPSACGSNIPYSQGGPQSSSILPAALLKLRNLLKPSERPSTLPYDALPYGAPALAGLLFFALPKRRRALRSLLTLLAISTVFLTVTGCGSACTNLGTRPGTYTIQVTGTSMGATPITITQNIKITVTE